MLSGIININDNIFESLFAISYFEQMHGLMFCDKNHPIMSFAYQIPQINRFWMKNVPVPLDIVFCCEGRINQICKGIPHSTDLIGGNYFSDLVVEFPNNTIKNSNIKLGDDIGIIKPTEVELKKIIREYKII